MHRNTLFNNLLQQIPRHKFEDCIKDHNGDRYVKQFNCWQLFLVLLYAQIRGRKSLRDIETGFLSLNRKLYHLGIVSVKRSTLSDALSQRPSQVFEDMFYALLKRCQQIAPRHKFRFKNPLYTFDSTTVDLCLSVFDWARFRARKGAIKIHFSFDHSGEIPVFLVVTDGKAHDLTVAKLKFSVKPDSITVMDKAYLDFQYLNFIEENQAFFVTRLKSNIKHEIVGQRAFARGRGVVDDVEIKLTGQSVSKKYPKKLRLVTYKDPDGGKEYNFLTNNFKLSAQTVAEIYRARWKIELFFKWIKQNLKIKTFLGTSKNAVLIQIWVAMIYFLLLAYIKFQCRYKGGLLDLHRLLREALFDYATLIDILSLKPKDIHRIRGHTKPQLNLNF